MYFFVVVGIKSAKIFILFPNKGNAFFLFIKQTKTTKCNDKELNIDSQ
jgi:hypothetical protein